MDNCDWEDVLENLSWEADVCDADEIVVDFLYLNFYLLQRVVIWAENSYWISKFHKIRILTSNWSQNWRIFLIPTLIGIGGWKDRVALRQSRSRPLSWVPMWILKSVPVQILNVAISDNNEILLFLARLCFPHTFIHICMTRYVVKIFTIYWEVSSKIQSMIKCKFLK